MNNAFPLHAFSLFVSEEGNRNDIHYGFDTPLFLP